MEKSGNSRNMEDNEDNLENFDEVIIVSTSNAVSVFDANTRNCVKVYKHDCISPKCLALLKEDYFIGALMNKPQISAWPVHDEKISSKILSTVRTVGALAVSNSGSYVAASIKEQICVWDVKSGEMLAAFSRHYQAVTCLRFTSDDSMFLSGGKDGMVFVWMLASVVSVNNDDGRIKPFRTWNNHSKNVTDIYTGSMGIYSNVATTSADMTCKIYELESGILLTTVCMDVILTSVVMDPLEYYVLLGTEQGRIYKINLYNEQPRELHYNSMESDKVDAHSSRINSLSISLAGDKLVSSSADKTVKVWSIGSLSCLGTLPINDDNITNVFFSPCPAFNSTPSFLISSLDRAMDENKRSAPKRVKIHHHPQARTNNGSDDEVENDILLEAYTKVNLERAADPDLAENLFQEAFKGETMNDIKGINAQLYTYLVKNVFENLESSPNDLDEENY